MSEPSGNEPCPCGSGRPRHACCGRDDTKRGAAVASAARESALAKLLTYAFHPSFDSDHAVAEIAFWGDRIRDPAAAEFSWIIDSEDATIKYNTWFLFDWELDDAGTVVELFIEESGDKLSSSEREYLERVAAAPLRLYEVQSVVPGTGVYVSDLWSGAAVFVIERSATQQMVVWDLLGARVASDGMGGHVFEGGLYLYPPDARDHVIGHFRRLHRRHHRKFPLDDARAFFRKHGMVFNHLWLQLVAFREPPALVTSDGEEVIFCRALFDTGDPEGVRALLDAQADVRRGEGDQWLWIEDDVDGERLLGTWTFEAERLVLETMSQGRSTRGREWMEGLAGGLVRYRATSLETVAQTLDALRQGDSSSPRAALRPDDRPDDTAAVRELYDRHYRSWLDRPLPALGNRTPRAAASMRLWRPKLLDLLKQYENTSERAERSGRPGYDFAWIWRELGLERPPSLAHRRRG